MISDLCLGLGECSFFVGLPEWSLALTFELLFVFVLLSG